MKNNVLIAQSGGPSAVINSSLAGVIKTACKEIKNKKIGKIYGGINGIEGILNKRIIDITAQLNKNFDEKINRLINTPAMALGSCRYKLSKTVNDDYFKLLKILKKLEIKYFLYIGGNDSMDTVYRLSEFFKSQNEDIICNGVPKTIDNDLAVTDHSPGFSSAAKFVATSVINAYLDASVYPQKSVMIVEIMGRNAGWLAASSCLARLSEFSNNAPHLIYLPEVTFDEKDFIKRIDTLTNKLKTVIVCVSEGIKDKKGNYVAESNRGTSDKFGHAVLGGVAQKLESLILSKLKNKKLKTRSIELNILQRVGSSLTSKVDVTESFKLGEASMKASLNNKRAIMPVIIRRKTKEYKVDIKLENIKNIANFEQKVPMSFISKSKVDVTEKMFNYLRPLVIGEVKKEYKDGIPLFFNFDKEKIIKF